ncbi:hypothetical protein LSH36_240g02035 [Paralvinella palmiformis]|uniref:Uncharacterized protein n=1 Tax=Paralvinella palmiformis TaxID=53620 RepID=A0AAD9N574_9ANNE|nr:hypothetical protein LSH36_240g02035 [Paralvinella palmiformis]
MLSRLPVDKPDSANPDEIVFVCMLTVNQLPVTSQQIAEAICKDTTLGKVYDHTHGWPRSCARDDEMYPFFVRNEEPSLEDGCIVGAGELAYHRHTLNICFMRCIQCIREL